MNELDAELGSFGCRAFTRGGKHRQGEIRAGHLESHPGERKRIARGTAPEIETARRRSSVHELLREFQELLIRRGGSEARDGSWIFPAR
jgi:hypothetical protein